MTEDAQQQQTLRPEVQKALEAREEGTKRVLRGETRDTYMVVWSKRPEEDDERPRFWEVGYYAANDGMHAKRLAMNDEQGDHYGVVAHAAQQRGVLLRAVPAQSWPLEVEATELEQPPPILRVR